MFEIKKFLGGFAFWQGEILGKIIYLVIIIVIVLAIYHQITKPTTSSPQKAEQINNYNPRVTFGCMRFIPK